MRGTIPPVSGASTLSFLAIASASGWEKLASRTRASGLSRASRTARWIATIVLPVPADPATRAGAGEAAVRQVALGGMEEDPPFLPRECQRLLEFLLVGDRPDAA